MPKLRFVHVGLGKCASTYLQNAWNQDPHYSLIDFRAHAKVGREFAALEKKIPTTWQRLSLPEVSGQFVISSCESFLYGYDTDPKRATTTMGSLFDNSAQIISSITDAQKILVMVRDPLAWARSAYTQAIKQGGSETFSEFLSDYATWVQRSLDLRKIRKVFGRRARSVVFLSADDLRHRPDWFWGRYESLLECPRPNQPAVNPLARNESLSEQNIKRLLVFNRYRRMFREFLDAPGSYPETFKDEYEGIVKRIPELDSYFDWLSRRCFEFADESLSAGVDGLLSTDDVLGGQLSNETKDCLRESFHAELAGLCSVSDEAKSQYERSLSS
jgi:hypothetical protein